MYAFSMIAYELFEGAIPFEHLHPVEAARRAAMNHARPVWGKISNRLAPTHALPLNTDLLDALSRVAVLVTDCTYAAMYVACTIVCCDFQGMQKHAMNASACLHASAKIKMS